MKEDRQKIVNDIYTVLLIYDSRKCKPIHSDSLVEGVDRKRPESNFWG